MIFSPSVRAISEVMAANTFGSGPDDPTPSLSQPDVAALNDGSFVVVWVSQGQDGDGAGVFGQRFDATGAKLGEEFQVNTFTISDQDQPAIAATPEGGFYVVWTSDRQDGFQGGIYGQKFDASGEKVGSEEQISSLANVNQQEADIVSFDDGSLFVAWEADDGSDEAQADIHGRGFSPSGEALSAEFQLNENDDETTQSKISLAVLDNTAFAVSWIAEQAASGPFFSRLNTRSFETLTGSPNAQLLVEERGQAPTAYSTDTVAIGSESYFSIWSVDVTSGNSPGTIGTDGQTKLREVMRSGDFIDEVQGTWNGRLATAELVGESDLQLFLVAIQSLVGVSLNLNAARVSDYARANVEQPSADSGARRAEEISSARLSDGAFLLVNTPNVSGSSEGAEVIEFQRFALNNFPVGQISIRGESTTGQTLVAEAIDLSDADGVGDFSYQWFRTDETYRVVTIDGATASEYVVTQEDAGEQLFVQVSYTDGEGTLEVLESDYTGIVGVFEEGTDGNDSLIGDIGEDHLLGFGGDDTLSGLGGNDTLNGGADSDLITGTGHLLGGEGNDQLRVEDFPEDTEVVSTVAEGGPGNDTILGSEAPDELNGGEDNDAVYGGLGDDTLLGGDGNDQLFGEDGNDVLRSGLGEDALALGPGRDLVIGNSAEVSGDTVQDFSNEDAIILEGAMLFGEAVWMFDGTLSELTADLSGDGTREFSLLFQGDLTASGIEMFQNGPDVFVGLRSIDGTPDDDSITGNQLDNLIRGLAGNDLLDGDTGNDEVQGGEGNDSLYGGLGSDSLFGDPGNDTILGGDGDDQLIGGGGNDTLSGEDGADNLNGGTGDDNVLGGAGNDTIYGGDGTDTLNGGDGNNVIIGGDTEADLRDIVYAGDGHDNVDAGYGNDLVYGMGGDDTIAGGGGADNLQGQDGNDVITGSSFSDEVFGGAGDDFVNGGYGSDRVNGGTGADKFYHEGDAGHGSDWIQDYAAVQGDVLLFGQSTATPDQFQVNFAHTVGDGGAATGDPAVMEAFVIYKPTGQIMWALVDGQGQDSINIQINGATFDLLV